MYSFNNNITVGANVPTEAIMFTDELTTRIGSI